MHCDVIRLVALDLVSRFIFGCMNLVAFKLNLGRYYIGNRAADMTGLRIPTDVIANREVLHKSLSLLTDLSFQDTGMHPHTWQVRNTDHSAHGF